MRKLIIDVENTTTKINDKYIDFSPYCSTNKLVSIGWAWLEDNKIGSIGYIFLHHNELNKKQFHSEWVQNEELKIFKECLNEADVLVAHNAKYDLQWLAEAGFDVSSKLVEDTMIREYVMARGRGDISFKLSECAKRYGGAEKGEIFEKYPDLQISEMPIQEVEEYGRADIQACGELYLAQEKRLAQDSYKPLHKTIEMMSEFCGVLTQIERNGVKIDVEALDKVEVEFTDEAEKLKFDLNILVKKYMGDTSVNLDSPQQLSEVIYSRRIKKGKEDEWINTFNIGKDARGKNLRRPKMDYKQYSQKVRELTQIVLRTEVSQCETCEGVGKSYKTKIDGTLFKKPNLCKKCGGSGAIYTAKNEVAGFMMKPKNIAFTTVSGFSTSQGFLDDLIAQCEEENKVDAKQFIEKLQRLSSVSSYLSNFVGGIKAFMQKDTSILHTNFNQCITATGRLSSTKPNMQNMPREATFPIRKCFISRFKNGKIIDTDFKTIEFRAAVHLAKDITGKAHILEQRDIHSTTAAIITGAGQDTSRQGAKRHTFKPLFAGNSGTEAERTYYNAFLKEIYKNIGEWHKKLEEEAIKYKMITTETGRQFMFPDVARQWHGGANKKTQIVNFPVQSFATADILPISIIRLHHEMQKLNLKAKIVLTVHDSVSVDCPEDEIDIVTKLMSNLGKYAEEELKLRYDISIFIPLEVETKIGVDLMEMEKVA